jgi:hypothetical protein
MSRTFEARLGKFGRNEQIRHTARGNSYSYLSVKSLLADNCILKRKEFGRQDQERDALVD